MYKITKDVQWLLDWTFREQGAGAAATAPPDAMTIYWATMSLPAPVCDLILKHACAGTAPSWRPPARLAVSLVEVRHLRMRYSSWVTGLVLVRNAVAGSLDNFEVTGPSVDAVPWTLRHAG